MKAVVQRVTRAHVTVGKSPAGAIGRGVVVLLGIHQKDTVQTADWLADKVSHLRIFEDADGKMNQSLRDVGGQMLVVSQFTLLGDCRKGRRPSFGQAAPPELAEALYTRFVTQIAALGIHVETGRFRTTMQVALTNDGPVTLIVESP